MDEIFENRLCLSVRCLFSKSEKDKQAEHLFRRYVDLFLAGSEGSYSLADVAKQIRELRPSLISATKGSMKKIFDSTLHEPEIESMMDRRNKIPKFSKAVLLPLGGRE